MSSPTLKDKPTLVTLEQFPCEIKGTRPNIVAKVANHYRPIGTLLLDDEDGSKVDNIEREALRNPEETMRGIFKTWLKQDTDCSWEKFINILKQVELNALAKDIEDALRECKEPTEEISDSWTQSDMLVSLAADLPDARGGIIEVVKSKIKELIDKFQSLKDATRDQLEKEGIGISCLVDIITSLPAPRKEPHEEFLDTHTDVLLSCWNIAGVFIHLNMHWEYLNYDILAQIITEFPRRMKKQKCLPWRKLIGQLSSYRVQLRRFVEETTLEQFQEADEDKRFMTPPEGFKELVTRHTWEKPILLKNVVDFRDKFAHKYDLRKCAIFLLSLANGSVIITMLVPKSIEKMIDLTDVNFFNDNGILQLQLSGVTLYEQDLKFSAVRRNPSANMIPSLADLCYNCMALEDRKEVLLAETLSLQQLVEKLFKDHFPLPELTGLRLKHVIRRVQSVFEDPFLWGHMKYQTDKDLHILKKLSEAKTDEIIFQRRVQLCDFRLRRIISESTGLQKYFTTAKLENEKYLRIEMFSSDPFNCFSDLLSTVPPNSEPESKEMKCKAIKSVQGLILTGLVTDLYRCPESNEWEGYIWAFQNPMKQPKQLATVYRFTAESFSCACQVYIGTIAKFQPSNETPSLVSNYSLRVLEYFPNSLSAEYAASYLQQLNSVQKPSTCLQRILDLPGPFRRIVNESRLYLCHSSSILAIASSTCDEKIYGFQNLLYMLHTSFFLRDLPHMILSQSSIIKQQSVRSALHLISLCIKTFPDKAHELSQVVRGCMKIVTTIEDKLLIEDMTSFTQVVIEACSQIRPPKHLPKDTGAKQKDGKMAENLLDPLLWVKKFYSEAVAQPLLELLSHIILSEGFEIVAIRKLALERDKHETPTKESETITEVKKIRINLSSAFNRNLAIQRGVVTDLYENGTAFIAIAHSPNSCHKKGKKAMFKFEHDMTTVATHTIHIGDIVAFDISPDSLDTVNSVVRTVQYCQEAIDVDFALEILSYQSRALTQPEANDIEGVFRNVAAWKAILNAPSVCKHPDICNKILDIVFNHICLLDTPSPTPLIRKKMLTLLKSSSFVSIMVFTPNTISKSVKILLKYLEEFPNEVCHLQQTLSDMVTCLSKQNMSQDLVAFVSFLTSSSCIIPPNIPLEKQPWQSVPVTLAKEEFEVKGLHDVSHLPKVKKRYTSVDEYGHTYFKLLRADCYSDLIDAVAQLRSSETARKSESKSKETLYDAKFLGLCSDSRYNVSYIFRVKTRPQYNIPITESSPKDLLLKPTNLLCFSIGGLFQDDIIWAKINCVGPIEITSTFKSEEVKSCEITVHLHSEINAYTDDEAMQLLGSSQSIVAVESLPFFRAYQSVLFALKTMDLNDIHFMRDFLEPGKLPKTSLEGVSDEVLVTNISSLYKSESAQEAPKELTIQQLKDVLQVGNNQLYLSFSQRQAVKQALSLPLTVIQGSPGTGKSYLGLCLLQLFLSMKHNSGQPLLERKPVFVLTNKNRSLDRFLLECIELYQYTNDIIRIGGRVSEGYEEVLTRFLLTEKIAEAQMEEGTNTHHMMLRDIYESMCDCYKDLEAISLFTLENCIPVLSPEWLQSLVLGSPSFFEAEVRDIVQDDPERCLTLLQNTNVVEKDGSLRDSIKSALNLAWDEWIKDISFTESDVRRSPLRDIGSLHGGVELEAQHKERIMDEYDWTDDTAISEEEILMTFTFDEQEKGIPPVDDSDVWKLSVKDRKRLMTISLRGRYDHAMERLKFQIQQYNMILELYKWERQKKALRILKKAKIVAMTMTGAAMYQPLLRQLEAPVLIVEEAAEILESNLLAILTSHVKHLVLIGDLNQSRPKLASQKLKDGGFDQSLFERLIISNYPCTELKWQYRMHPNLVPLYEYHYFEKKHIKEGILPGEITSRYRKPECMGLSFFWWSYERAYEKRKRNSQINLHEVEMVVSLCRWLIFNNVDAKKIAVITPYKFQSEEIKSHIKEREMENKELLPTLLDIDVYTVEDYQGHEKDVVILSLVRSNTTGRIGFLKYRTLLLIGTSRQKSAFYIIGNSTFLWDCSPNLWREFIEMCNKKFPKSIGTKLPISINGSGEECETYQELEQRTTAILGTASQKFEECVTKLKSTAAALNWKPIGVHLGMDLTEFDEIEQGAGGNTEEAFQQMMMKWRTKKGRNATYAALIKALEAEKLNTGVSIVMEYQEQEQEHPRQDSPPALVSGLSDVRYIPITEEYDDDRSDISTASSSRTFDSGYGGSSYPGSLSGDTIDLEIPYKSCDMAEEVIGRHFPGINTLKRKRYSMSVQKTLHDPLLWLRLKHDSTAADETDEERNRTFDFHFKLNEANNSEEVFLRRVDIFDISLQITADDESSQVQRLRKFFAKTRNISDRDLRNMMFPNPFIQLPLLLSEVSPDDEHRHGAHNPVPLGSFNTRTPLTGLVTDMYKNAGNDGWEGFIWSCCDPEHQHHNPVAAGYKFTCASLNCAFPVYLGAIVEFHPSTKEPTSVANCSLKVLQYFPDTLPPVYAAVYLQQLEGMEKPSDRLQRILELPGPFAAVMNEAKLFQNCPSKILAVLASLSNDESGNFTKCVLYIFHTSKFLREFPKLLADQNSMQGREQSITQAAEEYRVIDMCNYLQLVTLCIGSYPMEAYQIVQVIQECMKIASFSGSQFTGKVSDLCHAVTYACSEVRKQAVMPFNGSVPTHDQETSEERIPSEKKLLDPLLWVHYFFGQSIAQSLSKFLSQKCLSEGTEVVAARKRIENTIIRSLESCAAKEKEKQEEEKATLPIVKKTTISCTHNPSLAIKEGIIIDLYQDGKGYVALAPSPRYPSQGTWNQNHVFAINCDSKMTSAADSTMIHIGDLVAFQVSPDSLGTVCNVVKVIRYCPVALDEEFALAVLPSHGDTIEALFQNEAAVKAILNAPEVYKNAKVYSKVLEVAMASFSDSFSSTPSIRKRMLNLLKSSSFICDLIEIAPQEASKSVVILQEYLQEFPNEVCTLVPTLNATVARLFEQNMLQSLANFISFLSTSPCILPPEIELLKQPWQSIPSILTKEELVSGSIANKAYLPVVKARGRYYSIDEYGRTYFVLLRADCHGELAAVISRLRDSNAPAAATPTRRESEPEVPVYDVSFEGLSNKGTGHHLVYRFNVNTRPYKPAATEMSPNDSPLLKAGNLLCFSVGGRFEDDIIWATINHVNGYVDSEDTPEGRVKSCEVLVQFCTESNSFSDEEAMQQLKGAENAVAVKSPAYYRAYQPVLQVLKQMDLQRIHFMPDLLNPGNGPQAPLEIIDADVLVTDTAGLYSKEAVQIPKELTIEGLRDVLERGEELRLYEYQRRAMREALLQPLSLIQGPPGTGKSYMGLQLLRLFLSMKHAATGKLVLENKPALVMAYKNRALDHFILECKSFCHLDHIVRIGHASDGYEEQLKPVLLRERVMTALPREGTITLRERLNSLYDRVKTACKELEAVTKLKSLENCIGGLTPEWLKSLILDAPDLSVATTNIVEIARKNPDYCLAVLQRKQIGKEDWVLKQKILTAWDRWVADIPSDLKSLSKGPAGNESDSEYDARERQMAEDDEAPEANKEIETLTPFYFEDSEKDVPVKASKVWSLSGVDRRRLIVASLRDRYEQAMERLKETMKQYNMARELYEKRRQEKALEILKKAKIVAMTTTGAAIHQHLLSKLEAPIVFVEEAAEILESNLLAVLTPHVKHMVLIGDHKQLKPNLACSKLERNRFNVSLFERLIRNDYPHTVLLTQNQMHPDLVPLFEYHYFSTKYQGRKEIRSGKRAEGHEKPQCMGKNFFWWSYEGKYETRSDSSQCNIHEAEMVVSLCCWLVCNKVDSNEIAVLTPYRGQLDVIKGSLKDKAGQYRKMPTDLLNVDVYTVDEYQGHEKDVIILSLVRSNTKGKIGFLSKDNRLVVGTSRQKCALYIVGNHNFLEKSSPRLWKTFINNCKAKYPASIDPGLPIIVGNEQEQCQSPEELEDRVKSILMITTNNAAAIANNAEPDYHEASPSPSGSTLSTPATVRSLPLTTAREHSPLQAAETVRQQSSLSPQASPPQVHDPRETLTLSRADSFRDCWLKLKDTAAAKNWKFIGRCLELGESDIQQIEKEHGNDLREAFYQTMLKWRTTKGEQATYDELIEALKKENLTEVAEIVQQYQQR